MEQFFHRLDKVRKKIHHSSAMKKIKKTPLHPFLGFLYRRYIKVLSVGISDYRHRVSLEGVEAEYHIETGDDFTHVVGLDGEKPVIRDFLRNLKGDDVVYDIGSHLGLYACLAAVKAEKVCCFEPHPVNLEALERNIELNDLENIKVVKFALSDSEETFRMPSGETKANAAVSDKGEVQIEAVTGDSLIGDDIQAPDVVKIDVEGHEYGTVEGLEKSLRENCRVLYCEVHPEDLEDFGKSEEEFYKLVEKMGFKEIDVIHERGPQTFIRAKK